MRREPSRRDRRGFSAAVEARVGAGTRESCSPCPAASTRWCCSTPPRGSAVADCASRRSTTEPGDAATRAADLVRRRCAELGVECVAERATDVRWRPKPSFAPRAGDSFAPSRRDAATDAVIVTAHTADDQVETVFLRVLRDAGARGLAGLYARTADAFGRCSTCWRRRDSRLRGGARSSSGSRIRRTPRRAMREIVFATICFRRCVACARRSTPSCSRSLARRLAGVTMWTATSIDALGVDASTRTRGTRCRRACRSPTFGGRARGPLAGDRRAGRRHARPSRHCAARRLHAGGARWRAHSARRAAGRSFARVTRSSFGRRHEADSPAQAIPVDRRAMGRLALSSRAAARRATTRGPHRFPPTDRSRCERGVPGTA